MVPAASLVTADSATLLVLACDGACLASESESEPK